MTKEQFFKAIDNVDDKLLEGVYEDSAMEFSEAETLHGAVYRPESRSHRKIFIAAACLAAVVGAGFAVKAVLDRPLTKPDLSKSDGIVLSSGAGNALNKNDSEAILSASDVGIDILMSKKIVSARYESHIPTPDCNYECENFEEITSLLNTISEAEFKTTTKPKEPIYMFELVIVETEDGSYSFGIIGGAFTIRINEERSYYTCSAGDDFICKLLEIQGR